MKCTVLLRCIMKQIRFQRLNLQGSQTVRGKRGSTRSDCWHVLFLGFYSRVETRYTDYGEFWHWNPSSKRRGSESQFSPETETLHLKALRQRTSSQFVSSLNFKIHFVDAEQKKTLLSGFSCVYHLENIPHKLFCLCLSPTFFRPQLRCSDVYLSLRCH